MDLGTILSGPIGAIFGAAGAIGGKIVDYKMRQLDHSHELSMQDKHRALTELEFSHKSEIAKVDADTQVTLREFDAVAASISADRATYGESKTGQIVDLVRGLIRPAITLLAMTLVGTMTLTVLRGGAELGPAERMDLLQQALFLSGVSITWWFGARPTAGKRAG
jgi:hypothetical protein